jgi:hypothetical protein
LRLNRPGAQVVMPLGNIAKVNSGRITNLREWLREVHRWLEADSDNS